VNIKEYIESGILEAYVLGALPEEEHRAVEVAVAQYPELKLEVEAIEGAMLQFAQATSVEPPAELQDKIWNALQGTEQAMPAPQPATTEYTAPKTIPLVAAPKANMQWARAAVWVALVGSLLANVMLWSEKNKADRQLAGIQQQVDTMSANQQTLAAKISAYEQERAMLAKVDMMPVVMQSAQPGHEMAGMMYWSKTKGEAYVSMSHMPMPPTGKQYQLWVIQDGKPVSMGTIPNELVSNGGLQKAGMLVTGGQAFAISLEKEGGNPTPTEVMVVGKIPA
jgi:anti-sigma-K factor RskA